MIFSQTEEFKIYINSFSGSRTLIKLICNCCKKEFYIAKNEIQLKLARGSLTKNCSKICQGISVTTKVKVKCMQCNKEFLKTPSQISKSKKNFCSSSCSCTYNNTHKTTRTRRSKLEIWLSTPFYDLLS